MAEQQQKPGELALVKAVRGLDQGGSDAIPDKLDQIWKILSIYPGGRFHAAEEMLVRWLLKNMNGASDDAQKLRRYPLTWRILGKVFSSIPLFSLAKSLADRRFVHVLQSSLKDVSEPSKGADGAEKKQSADAEMTDAEWEEARPRKKQRAETVQFDLKSLSTIESCLRTAEAVFEALRLLLARVESTTPSATRRDNHIGAEHIKSLFCSSASEMKDLIVPALKICQLAVHSCGQLEKLAGQETWISTISNLWDLHLQGEADAVEVATHFSPITMDLHCRLNDIPSRYLDNAPNAQFSTVDRTLAQRWGQDLRRFLSRGLMLPARAAFLNKGDLAIIRLAIQTTSGFSTISCPVILDLALSSPSLAGSQATKKDDDSWNQAIISLLDETLQATKSKHKSVALEDMIKRVQKHEASLSIECLRAFCKMHALGPDGSEKTNWLILTTVAEINPDVFVAGEEGSDLLQDVLNRMAADDDHPAQKSRIVQSISTGFVDARDSSTFVKIWFQHLVATEPQENDVISWEGSCESHWWYSDDLCTTISQSLEKTMNYRQIVSLLDWLDSQADGAAENVSLILLLETLSQGITQDEIADSVCMRVFHIVSKRTLPSSTPAKILRYKWRVLTRCLEWATLEEVYEIWTASVTDLQHALAERAPGFDFCFGPFKFAVAAWLANYPGGKYEDDAAEFTISALFALSQPRNVRGKQPIIDRSMIRSVFRPHLGGCPRLLSMLLERGDDRLPQILDSILDFDPGLDDKFRSMAWMRDILETEANVNSRATMDTILKLVSRLGTQRQEVALVAKALLVVPDEAISRERREELMASLVLATRPHGEHLLAAVADIEPVLSLMGKLMRRPTFYSDMKYSDIDSVAILLARVYRSPLKYLPLLEELATLTLKQMGGNVGPREESYFCQAVSAMRDIMRPALGGVDGLTVLRIVLLKTLIVAVKESTAARTLPTLTTLDVREHERHLVEMIESVVEQFCSKWADRFSWEDYVPSVSAVLKAVEDLGHHPVTKDVSLELKKVLSPYVPQLKEASQELSAELDFDVWALRKYLAIGFSEDKDSFSHLGQITGGAIRSPNAVAWSLSGSWYLPTSEYTNKEGILEYVDAATAEADDKTKLKHIETLLVQRADAPNQLAQLLAIHQIIQQLGSKTNTQGSRTAGINQDTFDLATAHMTLCKRLRSTVSRPEFILTTQILETILDEKSNTMTQWNIELTLSTVSILASQVTMHKVMSSIPKAYTSLCNLVQVIVRRHRLRLEGHFHLLVTVLQSLLRALICHPYKHTYEGGKSTYAVWQGGLIKDPENFRHWTKHAKAFSRLLTMVCEPTPGSVARSQQSSLDSATDAAKRYAGQHMYLVLMLYIKLQLEQNVPHNVREALEPGVFAILDITSPEGRRIMNDALDASGRAIMKELYKQYLKFGKWSGV